MFDPSSHPEAASVARSIAAEGKSRWPTIAVDEAAFVAALVERFAVEADPAAVLGSLHGADLYLAFGCASGCPRAHAEFERHFMVHVGRYVSRIDSSASFVDELCQQLRSKLFVGTENGGAKILDYSGRGPLGGWLRVAAIRTAQNAKQGTKSRAQGLDEDELRLLASSQQGADPELHFLKEAYRREFRDAFEKALASLSSREQMILRLYYLDGSSSSAIAKVYGVSGAAVRAWVKDLRATLLAETRKRLVATLRIADAELGELIAAVESRFELTLSRVLRASPSR